MTTRSQITENNKKQPVSTAPAQGMFESRPFAAAPQTEEQSQQPDLKTALQRAERYGHRLDRIASIKPPVQAKLTIGQPGDRYEQEADQVAAQVVNSFHAPTAQRQEISEEDELQMKPEIGSIQREAMQDEDEELQMKPEAGTIERQELPEEDEELQMQPTVQLQPKGSEMAASQDLETSIQQAKGSGQPLADNIKEPMEQAFGADFSGVKIHTDAQSDQLNRSIQARAFTTGQDVFFRSGEYNPGSRGGQELIAHELTHVVQQQGRIKAARGESIDKLEERSGGSEAKSTGGDGVRAIWEKRPLSFLNASVVQRVAANTQKVTKSDIGSFLNGFGTVLAATINGSYVGKFTATGGAHAEQNFVNWVTQNWNQLIQDNQIQPNQLNQIEIRITRSPCGQSSANCGQTLTNLLNFFQSNGTTLDLTLLMLSLYQNSPESVQVLQNLYNRNVEMGAWEVFDELQAVGNVQYEHLNAGSLNQLSNQQRQQIESKLNVVDHTIHNSVAV